MRINFEKSLRWINIRVEVGWEGEAPCLSPALNPSKETLGFVCCCLLCIFELIYLILSGNPFSFSVAYSQQTVTLSRTSPYELEGQETVFTCKLTAADGAGSPQIYVLWSVGGRQLDLILLPNTSESRLSLMLYRNLSGSELECVLVPIGAKASLTLNVMCK